jgi:predicted lipoprotein with Yx(FWY)xxD motif
MKNRFRSLSFGVAGMVIAAITLAAVMGSAQAAPGAAARLSVRSSEYGKTLFGPTGKVVYVFGADRGSTSWCLWRLREGVAAAADHGGAAGWPRRQSGASGDDEAQGRQAAGDFFEGSPAPRVAARRTHPNIGPDAEQRLLGRTGSRAGCPSYCSLQAPKRTRPRTRGRARSRGKCHRLVDGQRVLRRTLVLLASRLARISSRSG